RSNVRARADVQSRRGLAPSGRHIDAPRGVAGAHRRHADGSGPRGDFSSLAGSSAEAGGPRVQGARAGRPAWTRRRTGRVRNRRAPPVTRPCTMRSSFALAVLPLFAVISCGEAGRQAELDPMPTSITATGDDGGDD